MTPIQNTFFPAVQPPYPSISSWQETLLISAVALAALSSFVQIFVGSFTSLLVYSFLGTAAYLGYLAQKNSAESRRREEYYLDLQKNTEGLRKEKLLFREENKNLLENNQRLKEQVDSLTQKLKSMEELLTKVESSAEMTQELLRSCIDVSRGQKKTEIRIQDLITRLEKGSFLEAQKEVETHVKKLSKTIHSMEKEIKQFFLHDSKGTQLVDIKREFIQTSFDFRKVKEDLEKVQKELSETSERLQKTSIEIESKMKDLKQQEKKLSYVKNLTPIVIRLFHDPDAYQNLSLKEKEQLSIVEKNWEALISTS